MDTHYNTLRYPCLANSPAYSREPYRERPGRRYMVRLKFLLGCESSGKYAYYRYTEFHYKHTLKTVFLILI